MEHGGVDLEKFNITSTYQAFCILLQISYILAFAESAFKFEHRDLHWGNILIKEIKDEFIKLPWIVDDQCYILKIPSGNVKCFIIDLTLSRLEIDGFIHFSDLDQDPSLFEADDSEDFQFTVYKLMKKDCVEWSEFNPKTNIMWLKYLIEKLIDWKKPKKSDKKLKSLLKKLFESIEAYGSVTEMIENDSIFEEYNKPI